MTEAALDVDRAAKLSKCKALDKLKKGELHSISLENTQELFDVLDISERGELSTEDLRVLKTIPDLSLSDEDLEQLIKDCDKDGTGKISVPELYQALTQGSLVMKTVLNELGQGKKTYDKHQCSRWELLDFLRDENETMEALCSLPITLLAFILFFLLIGNHLETSKAYAMQTAILDEVEGEGKPYLGTYVHDVPTFWYWMETSFVSAQFKSMPEKLVQYPYPGRFVAYNQIIGGTQVVKTQTNAPIDCAQSEVLRGFYDTRLGRCHKQGDTNQTSEFLLYHESNEEIVRHIKFLEQFNWIDHNTLQLDFRNLYYNANLGEFTDFHLTFDWLGSGTVRVLFSMESWIADPYEQMWLIGLDLVYMLILARMSYQEMKEMLPRLLNGLDGFIQYWEFWNVVDWLNIIFGAVFFILWGLICTRVSGPLQDAISKLPTKQLDDWVIGNQTYFLTSQLEDVVMYNDYTAMIANVHEVSAEIAYMHEQLRMITFFYSFTLMLKFFKAFRANPRLNIVIMTISDAAIDIIHFFLVFLTIFLVFSMMAVIIFGTKMREFSEQKRSFFYCWRILLGDFDVDEMEMIHYWFANVWFLGFQIMVMMILLNMLLAIIMDTYSGVVGKGGNKTIWDQTREAVHTVRETRGHLPLLYIRCEMEDEDQKAHPGERVNSKSLRKAFERDKMTRSNADYLIRKTVEYLQEREEQCELKMHDAVRLVGQTKTMVLKISQDTATTVGMLKAKEREPLDLRQDAIMAGLDPDNPNSIAQVKAAKQGIAPGVPVGGPGFGAPQSNNMTGMGGPGMTGPGGMPGMPGAGGMPGNMMPGMPGTQPGMPGIPGMVGQEIAYEPPFTPANAQNVLAMETLHAPQGGMMQLANAPHNQSGNMMGNSPGMNQSTGFGMSGMSGISPMGNNTMSSMGGMGSMGGSGGGMNSKEMQQMMMMSSGSQQTQQMMGQVMQQMSGMQQMMGQMSEMISDQRNYIEQRDSWLETRMSQLDRRCQKVEVLSDRLYTLLRSFDVNDLAAIPREVTKALNNHFEKFGEGSIGSPSPPGSPKSPSKALRDLSSSSEGALALSPGDQPGAPDVSGHGNSSHHRSSSHGSAHSGHGSHHMEEHMKTMTKQMDVLLSHAEATPQITRLLWRMDLNLRQLTGTASNLPPQQFQQVMPQDAGTSSAPSKLKPPAGGGQGSRSSSRLNSKQRAAAAGAASQG